MSHALLPLVAPADLELLEAPLAQEQQLLHPLEHQQAEQRPVVERLVVERPVAVEHHERVVALDVAVQEDLVPLRR